MPAQPRLSHPFIALVCLTVLFGCAPDDVRKEREFLSENDIVAFCLDLLLQDLKDQSGDYPQLAALKDARVVSADKSSSGTHEVSLNYSKGLKYITKVATELEPDGFHLTLLVRTYNPANTESHRHFHMSSRNWSHSRTGSGQAYAVWQHVRAESTDSGEAAKSLAESLIADTLKKIARALEATPSPNGVPAS
ncbi:MAG: hypothetical protein AAF517_06100 [Planctomycetota bacterium]